IFESVGEPYCYPLAPGIDGYIPLEELPLTTRELFEYDPVKAKQMLADAGYPEGLKVVIDSPPPGHWWSDTSSLLVPMWEEIGVEVDLKVQDWVTWPVGDAEMVVVCQTQTMAPTVFGDIMHTEGRHNFSHYSTPYYDELVETTFATVDPDERLPLLEELFSFVLEEVNAIPIGMQANYVYWWPWVKNYYGERNLGCVTLTAETLWIDQALKAEMGY
ncbi:unnamed protein product, partial [marine sediment metagenome]